MPTVTHDASLETRMRHAETDVMREFAFLDGDVVHQEFEHVAEDLLRNARVTDFIPVLVRRQVRENLRSRSLR